MAFALKQTVIGPSVSPNLGLTTSLSDDADEVAMRFGDRLLLRADPRDVRKTLQNATGAKRIHYQAPNRDPLLFTGSGVSVGPIAGKYDGKDVFVTTNTGTSAAGTHNDLVCGPKSLNSITEFTVFGVTHFDASMLGSGTHFMYTHRRDKTATESCILHQYVSGVNYLSIFADQGDSGGQNHNLDTSTVIAAGVPFAYMFRVVGTSTANSRVSLYVNQVETETVGGAGVAIPEAGSIEILLGHLTADAHQWPGGFGRHFIVKGSTIDTIDDLDASKALMLELKALYGIA